MNSFLTGCMIFIAVLMALMIIRACAGPRFTDRLVAINLISTLALCEIFLLVVKTGEGFILDIALIYALVSFVTTTVLSRIIIRRNERGRRQRMAVKEWVEGEDEDEEAER